MNMSELHLPKHVQLDLRPFYSDSAPVDIWRAHIAVATAVNLCGDTLNVRAGVSNSGDHDTLAAKVGPGKDQRITLPSEMYTRQGLAVAWYYPGLGGRVGGVAGPMVNGGLNREARLTREQTEQCLRMATLAISLFVVQPPFKVLKQEDPSKIVVDETMLTEADEQFGRYITS